ncbi:MAG TPA: two-component regulator propeller domain-containing protein, partial [Thermoanaerobaculia bacterium]
MRSFAASRLPYLLAGWLLLAAAPAIAAPSSERGFPLIQTYDPPREASSQSFDIARDPRGALYIANGAGLLVYDGAWWRRIEIGKERTAFAVASDGAGRVAVGGIDELGYLAADAAGTLRFVSLLPLLPPAQRHFDQVLKTIATDKGFLFLTTRRLWSWDGTRLATIATFPGDWPYADAFDLGGTVYVWTREGISRLSGARLEPVPGGEAFRNRRVDLMLPADGRLLVSVRGEGLFLLGRDGHALPFAEQASRWTAAKKLLEGRRLADGRWALGSLLGGLLLLRPDGQVEQVIDSAVGLPDDYVSGMVLDREGSLWLALNTGLARVEVASPLSVIDRRSGLQGSAHFVARHQGRLWIATAAGLFTAAGAGAPAAPEGGGPIWMRAVPGVPSAWTLLAAGEDLLAGAYHGVYVIRGDGAEVVPGTEAITTFVLQPSRADPRRVWMGRDDGLAALRREERGWRFEGMIGDLGDEVRTIVEDGDGTLWCGTRTAGVVGVERLEAGSGAAGPPRLRRIAGS